MSESARGEGGRVWVPRKPQDARDPKDIPVDERYYFLEERYPEYGNLVRGTSLLGKFLIFVQLTVCRLKKIAFASISTSRIFLGKLLTENLVGSLKSMKNFRA